MNFTLDNGEKVMFRQYEANDFEAVQQLNAREGWNTLVERGEETKEAFENSNVTYIVEKENNIVGYLRGMTDKQITLYISELIIGEELRGSGIGKTLLQYVHNIYPKTRMELLGLSTSKAFYDKLEFRSFYGFRKVVEEWRD
ncbi:GNAT family N-acetyltransferase [Virgibacillus sp. DJP39]|uniref:GNAT family N-acetyltransferase n=1 Tax=Virgibacillus sp. DJP39 TaxID=3409790 RepID=UPI003BB5CAA3